MPEKPKLVLARPNEDGEFSMNDAVEMFEALMGKSYEVTREGCDLNVVVQAADQEAARTKALAAIAWPEGTTVADLVATRIPYSPPPKSQDRAGDA